MLRAMKPSSSSRIADERQTDDLVGRPIRHLACRFNTRWMPVAHRHKTAVTGSESGFQRPCLRLSVDKQGRGAAEAPVDLACDPGTGAAQSAEPVEGGSARAVG